MISKSTIVTLILLYFFTPCINGEDCIAKSVLNLKIDTDAMLSWDPDPDETCEITEYRIDIVGEYQYRFRVFFPFVRLPFLPICGEWQFTVTPISHGVLGFERRLVESIPLPTDADLSIGSFNITRIDTRDVLLEWDLNNKTHGDCTLRYRIVIEDEDSSTIQDVYVAGTSVHLHLLSPCVGYQLGIRAVNRAHPIIEGPMRYYNYQIPPEPEEVPRLTAVDIGSTTANLTFRLENPGRNRCPIRTLYVDGGNHFNISIPLQDSRERPPVEVNLRGLRPNSMYYMKVSVENSGGLSQAAQVAVQTKELEPGSQ